MRARVFKIAAVVLSIALPGSSFSQAAESQLSGIDKAVAGVIKPMMQRYGIPGMAVGIVANGQRQLYHFGVMSKASKQPVTDATLFEIGSVSKTFTATLASYAQVRGKLALSDPASKYLAPLRGSSLDTVTLLNLGTHTTGGMPLQVPDNVRTDDQLMAYFRTWKPAAAPGTVRTYANPSVGLFGMIAAKSMDGDFDTLMQRQVLQGLGLRHTYLQVPQAQMADYAQGYTKADVPARMTPGVIASEAYGIRTTADDLLRFVEANMSLLPVDSDLQRAITATHTGYYRIGAMTQDLIWEQYRTPVELRDLVAGNSNKVSLAPNPAVAIDPPLPPQDDVLINKTGSTNGFGAYVAFVPGEKIGIVLLANRNYPNEARVTAAHAILTQLTAKVQAK